MLQVGLYRKYIKPIMNAIELKQNPKQKNINAKHTS